MFSSAVSPTDLQRIFKKIYSKSNTGSLSTFILSNVQDFTIVVKALYTSFLLSPSCKIIIVFCSFTRKGLYFMSSPVDGNCNV